MAIQSMQGKGRPYSLMLCLLYLLKDIAIVRDNKGMKTHMKVITEVLYRVLKVFNIVKDNKGALPTKLKGAPLQVGLGTCHLVDQVGPLDLQI